MSLLPPGFDELERFEGWILASEKERHARRYDSSMDEIRDFYNAIKPKREAIVEYLNQFPMDELPADANRLFMMGLSFMEVSIAVEFFGRQQPVEGYDVDQMVAIE